jgi:hypothetical protein
LKRFERVMARAGVDRSPNTFRTISTLEQFRFILSRSPSHYREGEAPAEPLLGFP